MPKETYQIKCPQHIMFGDPLYFERFTGDDLQRFTVDYKTAKSFNAARLVLQEQPNKMSPEFIDRTMTLYLPRIKQWMSTQTIKCLRHSRSKKSPFVWILPVTC